MAEIIRDVIAKRTGHQLEAPRPLLRTVEASEPYPMDALGPLQSAAEAIQAHTKAPAAICAQSVLGAVALVTQALGDVELPSGQTRPTCLFLMSIAASGERKSAVDALALKPIYERESELRVAHDVEAGQFKFAHEVWEARRSEAKAVSKRAKKSHSGDAIEAENDLQEVEPVAPLAPILIAPDPTIEGFCKLTAIGHPALGIFSAEGGSFIGGYGMSKDHKLKTGSGMSSLWDGDPIKRVRAGDGATVLPGRRLSVHLMAQPDVAEQLLNDELLRSQGLLSRFLIVAPTGTAGTRFFSEPNDIARRDLALYGETLARLVRAPLPLRPQTRNELLPRKLTLTTEATRIWIRFHDFIEQELGEHGEFAAITGLANKAAEHAARLAAVMELFANVEAIQIDENSMANATQLVRHYLVESLRLRSMAATHQTLQLAQRVLNWLLNNWPEPAIYAAVIYNQCPIREVRDRRMALRIIRVLTEHGWLHHMGDGTHINGANRKEAWLIHGRTLP